MPRIHPTALVDPKAELAADVEVGAYSIVGPDVQRRRGHASSARTSSSPAARRLGARNRIFQFTSIGEIPQDRKYGGEPTTTTIGDDNVVPRVRDRSTPAPRRTAATRRIGNGNLFLAYTHVAHDCVVGNWTTFSNNAQLAGHVHDRRLGGDGRASPACTSSAGSARTR